MAVKSDEAEFHLSIFHFIFTRSFLLLITRLGPPENQCGGVKIARQAATIAMHSDEKHPANTPAYGPPSGERTTTLEVVPPHRLRFPVRWHRACSSRFIIVRTVA